MPCRFHTVAPKKSDKQKKKGKQHQKIEFPEQKEGDFDKIKSKYQGKMKEIDVRDLEMPMPMQTILENVEQVRRSFGSIQKTYFQISKTNSKLLKIKSCIRDIIK